MSNRIYDISIKHEGMFRLLSRLVWHADIKPFYTGFQELGEMPEGASVLDVPCGGGIAFRGLTPDTPIRYVAADASPFMLRRAQDEARSRGLANIEFVETVVERMPFDDATFDLCLSYNGLHCYADPPAAIAEMARVLRPGGELRGTVVVTGGGLFSAAQIWLFRRTDQFGVVGSADDVRRWLGEGGFTDVSLDRRGAYVFFTARRAAKA